MICYDEDDRQKPNQRVIEEFLKLKAKMMILSLEGRLEPELNEMGFLALDVPASEEKILGLDLSKMGLVSREMGGFSIPELIYKLSHFEQVFFFYLLFIFYIF